MNQPDLTDALVELIRRTSAELSDDVVATIHRARDTEPEGSPARMVFDSILTNVAIAKEQSAPICQDTGTLIFWFHYPEGWTMRQLKAQTCKAVEIATQKGYLRPNAVDSLTGKNSGNNLGDGFPVFHFEEWEKLELEVWLMLKGGGCENVGATYSLPDTSLQADRDLDGVRKVVLHGIHKAQGMGCAPGIIGIGIGGDRDSSMRCAKEQLLRNMDDVNPNPALADLEAKVYEQANQLGIGPMGFGGKTTILGAKAGAIHRLPASFFVSIAYMCWADRRRRLVWKDGSWEVK